MDHKTDTRNVIDEFRGLDSDRIRSLYSSRALPFVCAFESLYGTLNLGTLIRTSNAMGANRVIYFGTRRRDRRSEVGVSHYFPVEYRSISDLALFKTKFLVVGVENNIKDSVPYYDFNYPSKTLFVMGSEENGLSDEAKSYCDAFVYIPQIGTVRSLNCSVAGSIIMADYVRKYHGH